MSNFLQPDPAKGVFETLLVLRGVPVELDAHLARMEESLRELFGAELPASAGRFVTERARGLEVGRLRLTAAPDRDGVLALEATTASVDPEDIFPSWERAVALHPFPVQGWVGAHKWADRTWLVQLESSVGTGSLPLLVEGDEVLEASRANIFAVEQGRLVTPPADGRILAGVARARTIEAARAQGVEVREEALSVDRLTAAGEAFLTGSVRGVEPVGSVGDSPLRAPSPAAQELAAALRQLWNGEGVVVPAEAQTG